MKNKKDLRGETSSQRNLSDACQLDWRLFSGSDRPLVSGDDISARKIINQPLSKPDAIDRLMNCGFGWREISPPRPERRLRCGMGCEPEAPDSLSMEVDPGPELIGAMC